MALNLSLWVRSIYSQQTITFFFMLIIPSPDITVLTLCAIIMKLRQKHYKSREILCLQMNVSFQVQNPSDKWEHYF